MADQAGSGGAMAGLPPEAGPVATADGHAGGAFHGRRVSRVAVTTIVAGFLIGGLALTLGPVWWLFWAGAGLTAAGGLLGLATNIFDDWY